MDPLELADLAADPERIDDLPRDHVPELLAALEGVRARLWAHLSAPADSQTNGAQPPKKDRMLTVEEAAEILSVTEDWLYDNSDSLPFARKLAPRTRRFSERGLYRWLETRP